MGVDTLTLGRDGKTRAALFAVLDMTHEKIKASVPGGTVVELLANGQQMIVPPKLKNHALHAVLAC